MKKKLAGLGCPCQETKSISNQMQNGAVSHDFSQLHTYPNGLAVRNLIHSSQYRQAHIMDMVKNETNLPPWVVMLVSRATSDINTVDEFLSYYLDK